MIMKKILNIGLSALFVTGAMMLSGCSDKFLEEKNYEKDIKYRLVGIVRYRCDDALGM